MVMPRTSRIVVPNVAHHVTQRGNNRQDVFFTDDDRRNYLSILKKQSQNYGLKILGWCLMPNHVHLIAEPVVKDALAKTVGRTNFIYAQYVNRQYGRSGHLWQGRFYSCPMDEVHFWRALRYVEQNPVRGCLVRQAWEYQWSSASAHLENRDGFGLIYIPSWKQISARMDWKTILEMPLETRQVGAIRRNIHNGRPLGEGSFIDKLENLLDRRLRPLPGGRPKKRKDTEK